MGQQPQKIVEYQRKPIIPIQNRQDDIESNSQQINTS